MRQPVITVLLTTYRRPDCLKIAVESVLKQKKIAFELVIVDDYSRDKTKEVVKSFKDKRIRYFENKKNVGFPFTFRRGVRNSRGTYIFLLSDDDFILRPDTLYHVYSSMKNKKVFFGQTGLIFYDEDIARPYRWATPHYLKTVYFPYSPDLLFKTRRWHFGFASGNVYRRDLIDPQDIIADIWFSHVIPIYRALQKGGAMYFGDHFVLGKISKTGNVSYLNVKTNKGFHMEKMFDIYASFDHSHKRQELFKAMHLTEGAIANLVGIKLYTSNTNVVDTVKSILKVAPQYKWNFHLWINTAAALVLPKFVIAFLRDRKVASDQSAIVPFLDKIQFRNFI